MSKTFLVSDTHIFHSNLCVGTTLWEDKSGCRDFKTVQEHDNLIIENINSMVAPEDTLYHLGDVSVGSKSSYINLSKEDACIEFCNRVRCKNIILIQGNHDLSLSRLNQLYVFKEVYKYYELYYKHNLICFFHHPIRSWNGMSNGNLHLYGHCHHKDWKNSLYGRSMDIGLDGNNFKPWLLDDVIEILRVQTVIEEGHHVRTK